ncbi:hypothetical protein SLEP1_g49446 [Rubroshorea leprosula]|uniref:Uncharacterized protein n=1 Tax=Rubroshorea leprosula TaxID=152421 RepID=A0AAV5LXT1_9ROSI|nr:hypothetical protein SLEP1_g49446 [Rubroshorea leprosula]
MNLITNIFKIQGLKRKEIRIRIKADISLLSHVFCSSSSSSSSRCSASRKFPPKAAEASPLRTDERLEISLSFLLKNQVSGLEHSPKPRNFPDLRCLLPLCPPASAVWGWVRFSAP